MSGLIVNEARNLLGYAKYKSTCVLQFAAAKYSDH